MYVFTYYVMGAQFIVDVHKCEMCFAFAIAFAAAAMAPGLCRSCSVVVSLLFVSRAGVIWTLFALRHWGCSPLAARLFLFDNKHVMNFAFVLYVLGVYWRTTPDQIRALTVGGPGQLGCGRTLDSLAVGWMLQTLNENDWIHLCPRGGRPWTAWRWANTRQLGCGLNAACIGRTSTCAPRIRSRVSWPFW